MHLESIRQKVSDTHTARYGAARLNGSHVNSDFLRDADQVRAVYNQHGMDGVCKHGDVTPSVAARTLREHGITVVPLKVSRGENELASFLESIHPHEVLRNTRALGHELDIYLPRVKVAVEYNGEFWHSELAGNKDHRYHLNKTLMCQEHGIQLVHVWERQWIDQREIVEGRMRSMLGINPRVHARQTQVRPLGSREADEFLRDNHLQGSAPASVRLGLVHQDQIIAAITMGRSRYNQSVEWELIRLCNRRDVTVVGGASKLFTHFVRGFNPALIISYSDASFSSGGVYKNLGFEFDGVTPPAPHYTRDYRAFASRIQMQKHRLPNFLENFCPDLTAWDNLRNHGYDRIWDCGHARWVWTKPS